MADPDIHIAIPEAQDMDDLLALVNSDPIHLVSRTKDEVSDSLHQWRVVRVGRQIVACGCYDYFSPRIAEIRSVIVHPDYRGRGYAEALVKELVTLTKPGQQVFVVTSAPDFFRKLEFSECLGEKYILFYKHIIKS